MQQDILLEFSGDSIYFEHAKASMCISPRVVGSLSPSADEIGSSKWMAQIRSLFGEGMWVVTQ